MYHSDILKNMVKNKIAILSAIILICLVIICIFAPFLTPYDPNKQVLNERLLAPSMTHLWGTDQYGRDILTRCIYGCRISLSVGIISQLIATVIGYFLGVAAGYFGEIVDDIISFIIQVFSSFPFLLFAMALMYALGAGKVNLYLSLGFLSWAATARLIRSKVMEIKNQEYIQACKIDGGSNLRIILKHLLPNCIPMLIVSITLGIPNAILSEASLSYLGLGIPVPTASWGNMIAESQQFIRSNTYYSLFPGLCIIVTVMAFNMFGDGLRDALDPKLHSQKGGL
ncbi:oligopeptide ABC transporter, permease protein [Lachnoanaerobaculum saburreum F0468]|uniref:Oligopeptide ABC transporter, permease protein n=1 Tax=Lachnoanaerobaculum saburreum F0468 TaxID=1095750 RepID=I0R557_9FIRM|nr:ABC transporter permease [Lachnoanaerobaculum saburreum]EIC94815.1 oligopeptide ABC transporter, permease protein [Lachnoanaerobaculum saburreum F0468]